MTSSHLVTLPFDPDHLRCLPPDVMLQHFVESIFFFNDYRHHDSYNRFYSEERNTNSFALTVQEVIVIQAHRSCRQGS